LKRTVPAEAYGSAFAALGVVIPFTPVATIRFREADRWTET